MTSSLPFSAAARRLHWEALGREVFDLLVVGGGITGVGIALDAALRGLRVALVEAGDFAQGTSSRSSRLIHGGLRYLETFDFRLVFEASAERRRLLELAPHLVHPLPFLFPIWKRGPVGYRKLQAGLWLYDGLALMRNIGRHRMLGREAALEAEPRLRREGLRGGGCYYDAAVDDARLTLAVARAAHQAGAAMVSYAEVVGFLSGGRGTGGAVVEDRLGGESAEVRARLVINATGPWSDEVRRLADPDAAPRLRPTKGVHLMLRRERVGNRGALIFPSPVDGRIMFVLPWGRFTYLGTTDTDFEGELHDVQADGADVEYLLESANGIFPEAHLRSEHVISTWAGVRPLLAEHTEEEIAAGATSREHEIWRDPGGLLTVAGGKLTTYRTMAAEAVDEAAGILRAEHGIESGPSRTADLHLPGSPPEPWEQFRRRIREEAVAFGLTAETGSHLACAYGADAEQILESVCLEPTLRTPLLAGHAPIWAEVSYAAAQEMTMTVEDLLQRRLHMLYEAEDGGVGVARAVAERLAEENGWGGDTEEIERQVEAYRATVEGTRSFQHQH
ncbi:MAG TPA: glycerol-3-phosphate dehydrogenase/oxidase [Longimicrobiaceae bacterium]|nr:glycerol-3-phosphate dehydrogenase/oxidase [Longimicrobiaceae bacterium]